MTAMPCREPSACTAISDRESTRRTVLLAVGGVSMDVAGETLAGRVIGAGRGGVAGGGASCTSAVSRAALYNPSRRRIMSRVAPWMATAAALESATFFRRWRSTIFSTRSWLWLKSARCCERVYSIQKSDERGKTLKIEKLRRHKSTGQQRSRGL